jgi:gamma-glutamylcyclotransferase (GGCT)/AIG2-like uncharacterized protein YtfP
MQYLFAYGLLRGDFESRVADLMAKYAKRVGPAKLRAQLFDIGGYPGVLPPNTDTQFGHGELFEVTHPDFLWLPLDRFEGISSDHAEPYEYRRELATVTTASGAEIEAAVYWYNWPVDGKVRICSGDYLQRVASTGKYGRDT